jgi:hypothetical protein
MISAWEARQSTIAAEIARIILNVAFASANFLKDIGQFFPESLGNFLALVIPLRVQVQVPTTQAITHFLSPLFFLETSSWS